MFAFAVWDQQEEKLYLIRDPFGIKPLYYILRDKFFFASEVKVLEAMGLICLLKRESLETLLTLGFTHHHKLFLKIL